MSNIFLEVQGLNLAAKGETTQTAQTGKYELISVSHSMSMPLSGEATGSRKAGGPPVHSPITIVRYTNTSSPAIYQGLCLGAIYTKMIITFQQPGTTSGTAANPITILTISLDDVIISNAMMSCGADGKPVETLTLSYSAITWQAGVQSEDDAAAAAGQFSGSWSLRTNSIAA
ncbi:Hcp family type VI secretion system effector [Sorangium sp. So ce1000]|uniref:Hcp family type VI secretion system effector n=1 Tax=Sorangium sp. So ce1000 TaxID=3133325 RepID=UPI003F604DA8